MNEKIVLMKLDEIIDLATRAKEAIEKKDWDEAGCKTDDIGEELTMINDWLERVA